jgi:hypothetical protein
MTYDADIATVDLQIERLRTERRRHAERCSGYPSNDTRDQDARW